MGTPAPRSSNTGQNGNLPGVPVGEAFIPGAPNGGIVPQSANQSRGNGVFYWSPQQSRIDIETRTPTAWGEVADLCRLRLGRRQQFQRPERAAGRRRQPDPAPPLRLWHVGRVPRRPGPLELLGCRRRHRIDGFRRRHRRHRRPAHPAAALYHCRPVWQRLLDVGRTTDHRHDRAGRHDIQRRSPLQ